MIKMIIEMDEKKINSSNEYTLDRIYSALDRIFSAKGMEKRILNEE
ncbi:MAG: hypothetical protein K6G76_01210 [Lachnospiraceae bacterium]|nr:hypothetical protein [Lachnospiraceae bacterium]